MWYCVISMHLYNLFPLLSSFKKSGKFPLHHIASDQTLPGLKTFLFLSEAHRIGEVGLFFLCLHHPLYHSPLKKCCYCVIITQVMWACMIWKSCLNLAHWNKSFGKTYILIMPTFRYRKKRDLIITIKCLLLWKWNYIHIFNRNMDRCPHICYGLKQLVSPLPPKSYVEILVPNVVVKGGKAFGTWLGQKGGALMNGISVL